MTLREGLKQFRSEYEDNLSHHKTGLSKEAEAFFYSHDVAHVLFGCDISLFGEGAVKIWTIFGTTLGFWKHFGAYKSVNAYSLAGSFTFIHILRNIFKFLFHIPTIIIRARRMSKSWDWADFEDYLDIPIPEIRREFNILVLENKTIIKK